MKRYSLDELKAMLTIEEHRLQMPVERHLDVKVVFDYDGNKYRWALIRENADVPLLQRLDGEKWVPLEPVSVTMVVDPIERAAREAHAAGNYVMALLLIHAALEGVLRANAEATPKQLEKFYGTIRAYEVRLGKQQWPPDEARKVIQRLDDFNNLRNRVVHEDLWREGLDATNAKLGAAGFDEWIDLYETVLRDLLGMLRI
jgi:hypothetical protein